MAWRRINYLLRYWVNRQYNQLSNWKVKINSVRHYILVEYRRVYTNAYWLQYKWVTWLANQPLKRRVSLSGLAGGRTPPSSRIQSTDPGCGCGSPPGVEIIINEKLFRERTFYLIHEYIEILLTVQEIRCNCNVQWKLQFFYRISITHPSDGYFNDTALLVTNKY